MQVTGHRQLTHGAQPMYGLGWTPDSRALVYAARRPGGATHLYLLSVDGGAPKALTSGAGDYVCPSVSADGKTLFFWHGTPVKNLTIVAGPAGSVEQAITEDEYHLWPSLSPSGARIASVVRRPNYNERLYITDVATKKRFALTSHRARHPSWIDDGPCRKVKPRI